LDILGMSGPTRSRAGFIATMDGKGV